MQQILTDKSSSAEAIEKFRQIIIHPPEPPPTDDDRSLSDQVVTKAESEIITSRNNKEHHDCDWQADFAKFDPHQSDYQSDLQVTSVDSQNLVCNTLVNVSSDQTESLSSATKKESSESFEEPNTSRANSSSQSSSEVKNWKSKAGSALKTGAVAVGAIAAAPILLPALGASALAAKVKGATKGKGTKFSAEAEEEKPLLDLAPEDLIEGAPAPGSDFAPDSLEVQTPTPLRSKDTPVSEDPPYFTPVKEGATDYAHVEKEVSELTPETPVIPTSESDLINTQKEIQSEKTSDLTPAAQEIRSDCAPAAIEDQPDFAPAAIEDQLDFAPTLNQEDSEDEVDFVRTVDPIEEEPAQLTPPNPTKFAPVDEFTPLTTDQPTKSTTELTSEFTPEEESAPVILSEKGYTFDDLVNPEDKLDQELESQESFGSESQEVSLASKEVTPVSREATPAQDLSVVDIQKVEPDSLQVAPENQEVAPGNLEVAPEIQEVAPEKQEFAPENQVGAPEKLEVASDCKDFKSEVSSVVPENSAPEIQKVLPEAQNVAPEQKLSGASQAKESSPENLNLETVSDHQKSIWDKAAEIDIPSEVHLSFEEEESEDLTSSPTQQKINDQPISKVGVNSSKLSKAETDFQIEQPTEQKEEKENQVSSSSQRLDYKVTKEDPAETSSANFAPQFHETTKEAQVYEDACLIKHSIDTESFQTETQESSSWKSTAGAVLKTSALAVGAVAGAAFVLPALGASAVAGSIASAGAGAASVSATGFATATAAAATTAAATAVAVKSATSGSEEITESAEQTEIDEVKGQENREDNRLISSSSEA